MTSSGSSGNREAIRFPYLARSLAATTPMPPTVLAGDFNEPQAVLADGTVIPFTMRQSKSGQWSSEGMKKGKCGRTFPRQRWVDG